VPASHDPGLSRRRPRVDCADPALAVEDALTLLATGRAGMARTVLEPLPGLIREARAAAEARDAQSAAELRELRIRGREREREERERPPRRGAGPRKPKPSELLAAALVSGRTDAARVAAFLRCAPADVQALAEGRVGLPGSTWRRLLREIGDG
jgi:hypothetical protein